MVFKLINVSATILFMIFDIFDIQSVAENEF